MVFRFGDLVDEKRSGRCCEGKNNEAATVGFDPSGQVVDVGRRVEPRTCCIANPLTMTRRASPTHLTMTHRASPTIQYRSHQLYITVQPYVTESSHITTYHTSHTNPVPVTRTRHARRRPARHFITTSVCDSACACTALEFKQFRSNLGDRRPGGNEVSTISVRRR